MQSTSWAMVVLCNLLEEVHNKFSVTIHNWVDDMTQRPHGQGQNSLARDRVV